MPLCCAAAAAAELLCLASLLLESSLLPYMSDEMFIIHLLSLPGVLINAFVSLQHV